MEPTNQPPLVPNTTVCKLKLSTQKSTTKTITTTLLPKTITTTLPPKTNATTQLPPKTITKTKLSNTKTHNKQQFTCEHCDAVYESKGGLWKHRVKIHNEKENGNIDCNQCKAKFKTIKSLIDHLGKHHNVKIEIKELTFASYSAFLDFKSHEEVKCNSSYVQQCGKQNSIDCNTQRCYYYCNRSGKCISVSTGKRQLKTQGSSKVGTQCTAHMKVQYNKITHKVHVEYCDYHHIHTAQLMHLRIADETRTAIAAQLQDGVSIERIMDNIRDKVHNEMKREQLVTRMDILNIKRQYNIECIEKSKNDLFSVKAWVCELEQLEYNPITIFKVQGEEQGYNINNLGPNDFILGIQTQFQRDMLVKFVQNGICIDTTHKTNQYNFLLLTLMVLDEFGEGIPVGWMISNREDSMVIIEFLKSIQNRTGNLQTSFFMSDDAEQFYNSWQGVFNNVNIRKFLCSWHIDRAWRKSLNELVPAQSERINIYYHLRTLLQCQTISDFRILLQSFISWLLENQNNFCTYFQNHYCKRVEEWAFCYSSGTPFNTGLPTPIP